MKIDVYVNNGYVDTVEVDSQENADDAAWETVRDWIAENYYWIPTQEKDNVVLLEK